MLDLIATVGAESIRTLWMPLAIWTLLWALSEGVLHTLRDAHPNVRYRLTQSVLWSLPLCLALVAWIPARWLPSSWAMNVWAPTLSIEPTSSVSVLAGPVVGITELATPISTPSPDLWLVGLGLAACLVVCVALVSLSRLVMQSVAVVHLRRAIPRTSDPEFEDTAQRIASSLGMSDAANIVLTSEDLVPMTLGIRRPLVVIPASLSADDRRSALVHELVHVRERDPLAQATEALVAALFSAHPAVHRLARQCELLREMACDAAVLNHTNVSRRSYAALVTSFASPSAVRALPATVGMASPVVHIHHRLHAMTTSHPLPSRLATWSPALALLLIAAVFVTAGSALAQTPAPEEIGEEPASILEKASEIIEEADDVQRSARASQAELTTVVESASSTLRRAAGEVREISETELQPAQEILEQLQNDLATTKRDSVSAVSTLQLAVALSQLQTLQADLDRLQEDHGEDQVAMLEQAKAHADAFEAEAADRLSLRNASPNPAQDEIVIEVSVSEASDVTVGLYDLTGRRLVERKVHLDTGTHGVTLDTSGLAAGAYMAQVTTVSDSGRLHGMLKATKRVTIVR